MYTRITSVDGGPFALYAVVSDPNPIAVDYVEIYYNQSGLGVNLPFIGLFDPYYLFGFENLWVGPGMTPVPYLFELAAVNEGNAVSYLWPYLEVEE